jgi:hypothetical protein
MESPSPNCPLRHVSIRVPWHDTGWDGRVCANPRLNGSCMKLKRIRQNRVDANAVAGQSLKNLLPGKCPCCVPERVAFMAPFEYTHIIEAGQQSWTLRQNPTPPPALLSSSRAVRMDACRRNGEARRGAVPRRSG